MEKTEGKPIVQDQIKCEVCDSNPVKYKCPRCEVQTCSLPCVQIHKRELECNGERSSTSYVPVSKMNNLNLLSDYRFLEGIDRAVNNCRRDPHRWCTRFDQPLPAYLHRLKAAAMRRGIRLQYLPQNFTRHKENKTRLDFTTQEITWKIDLLFPQGEMVKLSEVVNEKTRLSTVIGKYLDPIECPDIYKNYLKFYHASGMADVLLLLKAERAQDHKSVYLLDMTLDVSSNLRSHLIIENPTILVIKKAYKDEYNVLHDCEESIADSTESKYFGDFTPVSFFDELGVPKRRKGAGESAMDNIRNCANTLLGRTEEDESDDLMEPEVPKKRQLYIPTYENLCS